MTFAQFSRRESLSPGDICREMLEGHRESIKTKKEHTAVRNLELILAATLAVSNQKGFQAMSMRDLSLASGLSMGALYDYFSSKEELLEMIQATGRRLTRRVLERGIEGIDDPVARLTAAIRTHVYLSEALQAWFFFSYMEARHLGEEEKEKAKQSELYTEGVLSEIIAQGQAAGVFAPLDRHLAAAMIKAMLQDWYLKRWKYAGRRVGVDRYADFVVQMALSFCLSGGGADASGEITL